MNNRRSNVEIIADILKMGQAGKTQIMYGCNLSHDQLQKYLRFLVERDFIEITKVGNPVTIYKTSEKGVRLLSSIDKVMEFLEFPNGLLN